MLAPFQNHPVFGAHVQRLDTPTGRDWLSRFVATANRMMDEFREEQPEAHDG